MISWQQPRNMLKNIIWHGNNWPKSSPEFHRPERHLCPYYWKKTTYNHILNMDINFKNDALALVGIKSTDPEIVGTDSMETGGIQRHGWISLAANPPSETAFGAVFFSFSFSPETLICGMNEGLISSRESALIHDNIMAYMKNVRSRQTMKNLYLHLSVCIHQQVPLLRFSGWNLQMESLGKVWNYP